MKQILITLALSALAIIMVGAPALADSHVLEKGNATICPQNDFFWGTGTEENTVTATAPEGYLITAYCVKAGPNAVYVPVDPSAESVEIDHPDKPSISHYSLVLEPKPECEVDCEEKVVPVTPEAVPSDECESYATLTALPQDGPITYSLAAVDPSQVTVYAMPTEGHVLDEDATTEAGWTLVGDGTASIVIDLPYNDTPCDEEPEERERTTETEWETGEFECDSTTVTETRTVTTVTERSTDGGETWEQIASSQRTEERTRDLTDEELATLEDCIEETCEERGDCPEPTCEDNPEQDKCEEEVFCPNDLVYNEVTGKCELPDSGFGSVALALSGLASMGGGIALLRRFGR